ncbi:hypothetical protein MRX96_052534 [Rhipicephalus microplus]
MSYMSELTTDIGHFQSGDNEVADAHSRNLVNTVMPTLQADLPALATTQRDDDKLKQLLTTTTAPNLECSPNPTSETRVCCDASVSRTRPFAAASLCRQLFEPLHKLARPRIRANQKLVTARVVCRAEMKAYDTGHGNVYCHWSKDML